MKRKASFMKATDIIERQWLYIASIFLIFINSCSPKIMEVSVPRSAGGNYHASQVEPTIALNPSNPKEIIAGAVLNEYYYSENGGKTWSSFSLNSPHGVHGDPVVLVDNENNFFYFHLSNPERGKKLDRIVCQSTKSLSVPMSTVGHTLVNNKMHDKHWVVIDKKSKVIHMAWTQFDKYESAAPGDSSTIVYSNSADLGKTWTRPLRISSHAGNCLDDSGTIEGVSICIDENENVYVAFCLNEKIFLNSSQDGGRTWLNQDVFVADQPGGWSFDIPGIFRMNGFPSLVVDNSNSQFKGRLYLSWSDQRNSSNDTDVWLKYSDNSGKSWSKEVRVNDDKPGKHQFMSTLRIDPKSGALVGLFYDRRNHDDWTTEVFIAVSVDGGLTFQNKKFSSSSFVSDPKKFFGDYLALEVYDNYIYAMWPEMRKGEIVLKYGRKKISN